MYRRIYREDIAAHLQAQTAMTLIEALPAKYYQDGHLPGAIQLDHDQLAVQAAERLPDKDAFIVVYCANTACQNSRLAAQALSGLGYNRVAEYVEGKQDWTEAGLPIER